MHWHTQTYRYSSLPKIQRVYPLYSDAATAIAAIHHAREYEDRKAATLSAWNTLWAGLHVFGDALPDYARTTVVYRGQSSPNWSLLPTVYRKLDWRSEVGSQLRLAHDELERVKSSIVSHSGIQAVTASHYRAIRASEGSSCEALRRPE
jgi:hypothetical protein